MKKTLAALAAVLLTLALATAGRAAQGSPCAPHQAVAKEILSARGEAFVATAIDRRGLVVQVFAAHQAGTFSIVAVDRAGLACILLSGRDWRLADEREG